MAATQGSTTTLALNTDYVKSKPGILRIIEACVGLCGVISVSQGAYCHDGGKYSFYNSVVVSSLILAIIILIVFTISLDKLCIFINCPMTVFIHDIVFTVLYLIAAILMFISISTCRPGQAARIVAALFGVIGTLIAGLLAFYGYQRIRGITTSSAA